MSPPSPPLVDLSAYLASERIVFLDPGIDKAAALHRLAAVTARSCDVGDTERFEQAIFEREEVTSTGIGHGIAVPHAKLDCITGISITIGLAPEPIPFDAPDGEPVDILVMIAACDSDRQNYLRLLATVAALLKRPAFQRALHAAQQPDEVLQLFSQD